MGALDTPAAEVDITPALVRALLADQHPDLADRPLRMAASGWDNALYRLGDDLVVRLPRRALSAPLVEHEQRWLPLLAPRLPLPIPAPLRVGPPALGYPWRWSVCPWLPGRAALDDPPADLAAAAATLGRFLAALHQPAPSDAPVNPYRGVPLADRRADVHARVERLGDLLPGGEVLAAWEDLAATDGWSQAPRWLHGDMHPGNLLVHHGALSAVVDFGDLTGGDPASDLVIAWMLFPPALRPVFRDALGSGGGGPVDDATWRRGRGWALTIAVAMLAHSADNPAHARVGRATIDAALTDRG